MSAISSTLTALLGAGDHMLIQGAVYGATYELVHNDLKRLGIEATIIDEKDPQGWEAALRPNTKVGVGCEGTWRDAYGLQGPNHMLQMCNAANIACYCFVDYIIPEQTLPKQCAD